MDGLPPQASGTTRLEPTEWPGVHGYLHRSYVPLARDGEKKSAWVDPVVLQRVLRQHRSHTNIKRINLHY